MTLIGWRDFICYGNSGMFPNEVPWLPPKRDVDLTIELVPGKAPVSKTPYRVSTPEMIELKVQLQELLEKRYVKKSVSSWGAPFLIVKKKYGTHKMCIDFRPLNKVNVKNKSSYQQVRIKDENVHKTTFRERYGSYDVVVVSFGLKNSPATSMCLVNNVFDKCRTFDDEFEIDQEA